MALGDYPAEYNPKVHGPYDPARFYGKRECNSFAARTDLLVAADYVIFPD